MTIIAVQCRLSSSRLPEKALLPLNAQNKEDILIRRVMRTLKKAYADDYYILCDYDSEYVLKSLAEKEDWKCMAGDLHNVLSRFCRLVEKTQCRIVVRATGDNPYLFYETVDYSIQRFKELNADYFTLSGLPHGSGIEVFSGNALLNAQKLTKNTFDLEHVGPALYNYPETFNCVREQALEQWFYPNLRTTVDIAEDYLRVLKTEHQLQAKKLQAPYPSESIISAVQTISQKPLILLVPRVSEGHGTGHLRRCLNFMLTYSGVCRIYLHTMVSAAGMKLINQYIQDGKLSFLHFTNTLPTDTSLIDFIVADYFSLSRNLITSLRNIAPIVALDEGSDLCTVCDFLVNIIPPLPKNRNVNVFLPQYVNLPQYKKSESNKGNSISSILISIGGEDYEQLGEKIMHAFEEINEHKKLSITLVLPGTVHNLKETLANYDLVITHFGLTAFEAVGAGTRVLLVAPTPVHLSLARYYDCECLQPHQITVKTLNKKLANPDALVPQKLVAIFKNKKNMQDIPPFLDFLSPIRFYDCPICQKGSEYTVLHRSRTSTIVCCKTCGIEYIRSSLAGDKKYTQSYFFDEYQNQYGKTYLEDFEAIKTDSLRRLGIIQKVKPTIFTKQKKLLDIGCAYGPFLKAADEKGFFVEGLDIASEAVEYVNESLKLLAQQGNFPDIKTLGQLKPPYHVITMWYVIEHFYPLDTVLQAVYNLLKEGGIFAFATPNARGITRLFNKKKFYAQSPSDHFSLWTPKTAKKILRRYGFEILAMRSRGYHRERYPYFLRILPNSFLQRLSEIFILGDTFEIYCKKRVIMTKNSKNILILGASLMQMPALKTAKKLGFKVFVVDGNPHAAFRNLADVFRCIDLKDTEAIIAYAKNIQQDEGLDGVFTAGTDFSFAVASVQKACNIKGHSVEAAKNATDKFLMRTCFEKAGVSSPRFIKITATDCVSDCMPKILELGLPLVVKPTDNMGARGCKLVSRESDMMFAIEDALKNSKTGQVIIEQYMVGPEFSIDGLIFNNELTITGFAERHIFFPPYFIEMGHTMPAKILEEQKISLFSCLALAVKSLGLSWGAIKADIKLTAEGPMIGEIAARLSGGYMSGWTYPLASGLNLTEQAIILAMGIIPQNIVKKRVHKIVYNGISIYEIPCKKTSAERAWISIPGKIKNTYFYPSTKNPFGVRKCFPRVSVGDTVLFPINNVLKAGNIITQSYSRKRAIQLAENAVKKICLRLDAPNQDTEAFLRESASTLFPPSAYQLSPKDSEYLEQITGTLRINFLKGIMLPTFFKSLGNQRDWNGRTARESILLYNQIIKQNRNKDLDSDLLVNEKKFWKYFIRGGIQGALYYTDKQVMKVQSQKRMI